MDTHQRLDAYVLAYVLVFPLYPPRIQAGLSLVDVPRAEPHGNMEEERNLPL